MSTIRAKQQICLNIATIRCLSTYTSGRYCLRFSIYETTNSINNQTYQSQIGTSHHHHHISKYATPVSVIEYKSNINKNNNSNPHNYNYNLGDRPGTLYQINEHIYTTKPFLLKPNLEVPIYELAIFKHDINIFSTRYQNDFHDVVLRVVCELVQFDYSSGEQGKIVGVFDGRIRGAGINDAVFMDFLEGVTGCQVIGSVHSCVYQFEYVYTGGPIYYPLNTMNSNKSTSNNKKVQIIGKNTYKQEQRGKYARQNKQIGQINKNSNSFNNNNKNKNNDNTNSNSKDKDIERNTVLINNMTFQMYCNMQTNQYVQSLLQYLLKQIRKSQQKVNINLQVFQFQYDNNHQKIYKNKNKNKNQKQRQQLIQMEDIELMQSLTKSLFNQKQIDKNQADNRQRLSLIKSQLIKDQIQQQQQQQQLIILDEEQHEYQYQDEYQNKNRIKNKNKPLQEKEKEKDKDKEKEKEKEKEENPYKHKQNNKQNHKFKSTNNDDIEYFGDSDEEERGLWRQNQNKSNNNNNNIIISQEEYVFGNDTHKKSNTKSKQFVDPKNNEHEDEDELIFLQEQIWQVQQKSNRNNVITKNNNNKRSNGDNEAIYIRLQVDQDEQQRQMNKIKNKNDYKIPTTNADLPDSRILTKNITTAPSNNSNNRRRKIFIHSQRNINQNAFDKNYELQRNKVQNNQQQLLTPSFKPLQSNNNIQDLQLSVYSSIYQQRQIPVNVIHHHPNANAKAKTPPAPISQQPTKKISIQQFQKILHMNSLNIYEKWRKFISHLTEPEGLLLITAYGNEYRKKLVQLLGESVIRFKGSWQFDIYSKEDGLRNKMAYQIRNQVLDNQRNIKVNQFRFYDKQLFDKNKPIMFQQVFEKVSQKVSNMQQNQHHTHISKNKKSFIKVSLSSHHQQPEQTTHIIFLVHGLGACRIDMQKLKIQIKRSFKQKVTIITSSSNQGRTQGDIAFMGVRLAHEVGSELSKHIDNLDNIDGENIKVSFIGHSMGGIIIRSALPKLQKYRKLFHSYVTLSSPHVGYNYSSSKLIDVGLWLINNWKKCQSILQLTMSDTSRNNIEDSFLYKLSRQKGLQWFKKVTFLASRQDLYVPYFSARVQKPQQILTDIKSNNQYAITHSKMVDNMLSRIVGTLTRIDVNFCITEQNIDNLIGRAAHICFVNNQNFLRLLCVADQATLI